MPYLFLFLIFLFGAAVGSFVAVIASRYNTGLSFFRGRSICFSCSAALGKKDLVPVFSFVFLLGRCRHCGSKIPAGLFVTEILMGALSVLAAFQSGFFASFSSSMLATSYWLPATSYFLLLSIFAVILLISIYDLKHFIIPDSFLVCLFTLSLFYNFLLATSYWLLAANLAVGLALALPFLLIFLVSRGTWFGLGDVKYIAVVGFFLGFSAGLSAVVLSFWIGALFSIIALSLRKLTHSIGLPLLQNNLTIKSEIPFGPFISVGLIASFYFSLDLFHINELFF